MPPPTDIECAIGVDTRKYTGMQTPERPPRSTCGAPAYYSDRNWRRRSQLHRELDPDVVRGEEDLSRRRRPVVVRGRDGIGTAR
jgi:hypothetical protein